MIETATTIENQDICNTDINRFIHEQILGECWHVFVHFKNPCRNCGAKANPSHRHPDYCSDLDAVARVEKKVIEKIGFGEYADAIADACDVDRGLSYVALSKLATATAEQRARACVAAWKQ